MIKFLIINFYNNVDNIFENEIIFNIAHLNPNPVGFNYIDENGNFTTALNYTQPHKVKILYKPND